MNDNDKQEENIITIEYDNDNDKQEENIITIELGTSGDMMVVWGEYYQLQKDNSNDIEKNMKRKKITKYDDRINMIYIEI